jgi:branched-chain amino acid transport system substrate-binding protein
MRVTRRPLLPFHIATLLVLAACTPAQPTQEGELPEKLIIGYPASLTGEFEALGRAGRDGLRMFEQWVNEEEGGVDVGGTKIPVEIVFADDRSDKETAIRLFEKFVREDGAQFMMASYSSSLTLAEAPIAEQLRVLTFGWGASSDDIWEQGFTRVVGILAPASLYDQEFLEFVSQADPAAKTIAIVYKDDPFTVAEAEGAREVAEGLGMEVVFFDKYPPEATDLSPILTEAGRSQPDILLVASHFEDGALAARQALELRLEPKAASYGSASATGAWGDELDRAAEDTFGTSQWEPGQEVDPSQFEDPNWRGPQVTPEEWAAQFEAEFGYAPDFRAMMPFHSGVVLKTAIEEAGSLDTEAIRQAIADLEIVTVGGGFDVDPETLIQVGHTMITIQWQGGEKVIVGPEENATGEPVYPVT